MWTYRSQWGCFVQVCERAVDNLCLVLCYRSWGLVRIKSHEKSISIGPKNVQWNWRSSPKGMWSHDCTQLLCCLFVLWNAGLAWFPGLPRPSQAFPGLPSWLQYLIACSMHRTEKKGRGELVTCVDTAFPTFHSPLLGQDTKTRDSSSGTPCVCLPIITSHITVYMTAPTPSFCIL